MKIGLVGAGYVGATTAYSLMFQGIASELVLIDVNRQKAEGEALDLTHSASFIHPINIHAGDYIDVKGADIVIISAGPSIHEGETRLDLAGKNYKIFEQIIPNITRHNKNCILIIVTNPVDVMTYAALKLSGFPKSRVIGSGTVLDSSRFRAALSAKLGVDSRNIHGYILGEHGDTQVPAWSLTNIMGINFDEFCVKYSNTCNLSIKPEIEHYVKTSAYDVIKKKGTTNYAIALAVAKIVKSILRDENSILTVSTHIDNYNGIKDVCFSLPCIVNRNGVEHILYPRLSYNEEKALTSSAQTIKNYLDELVEAYVY